MPETSIVIKAEDRYSEAINKMAANTKRFNKDVETLEDGLLKLSKNKATLRMDLSQAQKELKAAEKQFAIMIISSAIWILLRKRPEIQNTRYEK